MRIAVDAMGGDFAPEQIVVGARLAALDVAAHVALAGPAPEIEAILAALGGRPANLEIEPAADVIGMGESPRAALRGRDDSSLARAVAMVADGRAQAVISAGNSGAFMALAATRLGTIPGVRRPAIACPMPTASGPRVLLDAGANADCKPEHLRDFALMGAVYAEHALGITRPRVGLLSIGAEKGKGNELTKAAYELIEATDLNFLGNVEPGELYRDGADVFVADGFVGNVVLKTSEAVAAMITAQIRAVMPAGAALQFDASSPQAAFEGVLNQFDHSEYGGALLLGVNGVSIVGHGCADAHAIDNAVRFARDVVQNRLVERISEVFAERAEAPVT